VAEGSTRKRLPMETTSRRKFFLAAAAGLLAVPSLLTADDRYDRERERAERDRLERERFERERARDQWERDRAERERAERERAERERAERERAEHDRGRRRERWVKLGERTVGRREEVDVIELHGRERFTAVWFQVEEGALELDKIKITFGNRETFTPETRLIFREGERTPLIDLPNGERGVRDREIVKIGFRYRGLSRREATIVAWGRVFEGDRR
jgi:hypothetical protein